MRKLHRWEECLQHRTERVNLMEMPLKVKIVKLTGQREETSGLNAHAADDAQPAAAWGRKPGFQSLPASEEQPGVQSPLWFRGVHTFQLSPKQFPFWSDLVLQGWLVHTKEQARLENREIEPKSSGEPLPASAERSQGPSVNIVTDSQMQSSCRFHWGGRMEASAPLLWVGCPHLSLLFPIPGFRSP